MDAQNIVRPAFNAATPPPRQGKGMRTAPPTFPVDGETALAAPLGSDLVLIAGTAPAVPSQIQLLLNGDPSMAMPARMASWPRTGAPPSAAYGFVAIVPVAVRGTLRLRSFVMRLDGHPLRFTLDRRAMTPAGLMQIVSQDAGVLFPDVAEGVTQAIMAGKRAGRHLPAIAGMIQSAARNDGFVEVLGALDSGELFLQGWATELVADTTPFIVVHEGVHFASFTAGLVERQDLAGRGTGFAGILRISDASIDPQAIQRLFFRHTDGWRAIEIYEKRVALAPTDVPAHIRDVVSRVSGAPDTIKVLRAAGDRFDGRDTVSSLGKPVRMGIDMVAAVPGGILVGGWMLDVDRLVESVSLRAGPDLHPASEDWARMPRPDVTNAFLDDPSFGGRVDPFRHDHGFLVFAPGLAAGDDTPVYFELSFGEEGSAFYPLKPTRVLSRRALERLISALDPRTVTAAMAIERHIGPMMQAVDVPAPRIVETRDFGYDETAAPLALVVGTGIDVEETSAILSLLALDASTRTLPIIVSAPIEALGKLAGEVQRLAQFYGLGVRLIASEQVADACDAFEAAASATKAETLVLLASGVFPKQAGWVSLLERAYRARGGKALVSPTIVFEDDSICFAGTWLEGEGGHRRLVDRYAGYPRDVIRGAEPTEVITGSTSCCIVSRSALETTGGFSRSYLRAPDKGRDLCLKLKLAGTRSYWLPDVEMIAAEDSVDPASTPWNRLSQRIDRWSFDRRWSLLVGNMRS